MGLYFKRIRFKAQTAQKLRALDALTENAFANTLCLATTCNSIFRDLMLSSDL